MERPLLGPLRWRCACAIVGIIAQQGAAAAQGMIPRHAPWAPDNALAAPPEKGCRESYFDLLRRLNAVLGDARLPQLPIEKEQPFQQDYDRYYRARLGVLGRGDNSKVEVSFLGPSCSPIDLLNGLAMVGGKGVLYDSPPPANWPSDKAIGLATKLLCAFVGEERAKVFTLRRALFHHPCREHPRYYRGEWYFWWSRKDPSGYEFANDGACINLVEDSGLLAVRVSCYSRYQPAPGEPIEPIRASTAAKPFAAKILCSRAASGYLDNCELLDSSSATLRIVNPNHILRMKSAMEFANLGDVEAKLAWVVKYPARYAGREPKGKTAHVAGEVDVWVDAHTGEFLGGDFRNLWDH